MARFINPFTDYGFKKIFGQEVSKELLIDFLNVLLAGERVIRNLTFLNTEQLPPTPEGRVSIYDLYCETDTGEYIIVEMQNRSQVFFKERALYYLSRTVVNQGVVGEWDFHIKAVYGVFFMNFLLHEDTRLRTDVILADRDTGELFSDKFRQIFIALPAFKKTEEECETDFERWIYVLKNMTVLDRMPFEARKAVFKTLEKVASVAALSDQESKQYNRSVDILHDNYAVMASAKTEGLEEGMEEGKEIGRKEGFGLGLEQGIEQGLEKGSKKTQRSIARNLKAGGISFDLIAQSTGLTPEEIETL